MKEQIIREIEKRIKDNIKKGIMYLSKMDTDPEYSKYYEKEYLFHQHIVLELQDLLQKVKEL